MKKFFRILVVVIINIITLPIQLILGAIWLLSNLTKEQKKWVDDFCEGAWEVNKEWVKNGTFDV